MNDRLRQWLTPAVRHALRTTLVLGALLVAGTLALRSMPSIAQATPRLPPPAVDEPPTRATSEVAVLAGGCFWGIQGVFQHVDGVISAVSGYTGGSQANASYGAVETGNTGHAESVQITYDPQRISYGRLLQIFFSVHDPTQLDRQGPDSGTQYRSAIFPRSAQQAQVARDYIAQLNRARVFHAAIVTTVEPGRTFYRAEDYHQNFLAMHPTFPYIVINDLPKIAQLRRLFPQLYRGMPVLVAVAQTR